MLSIKPWGAFNNQEVGELGGVQAQFSDGFFMDFGRRPDYFNRFFGFMQGLKPYYTLEHILQKELFAPIPEIYRPDVQWYYENSILNTDIEAVILTHAHDDHVSGTSFLRPDIKRYMNRPTKKILYVWEKTTNDFQHQFINYTNKLALMQNKKDSYSVISGDKATIPINIETYLEGMPFQIKDTKITMYPVDHSMPGTCGAIIENENARIGWSADWRLRGRRRKDTDLFIEKMIEKNINYFFVEGSLLDFSHEGTEDDITFQIAQRLRDYDFVTVSFPPRDLDRLLSVYLACESEKRTLVISPEQAKFLEEFRGEYGLPEMDMKYIGVMLPRQGRGRIGKNYSISLVEQDYDDWQREFLYWKRWEGHEDVPQIVYLDDIGNHPEQFVLVVSQRNLANYLAELKPKLTNKKKVHIRSNPQGWNKEMEVWDERTINLLKDANMYEGPYDDVLNPGTPKNMLTIHVTGHMNYHETFEKIKYIVKHTNCTVLPFHCKFPQLFVNELGDRVKILNRGEEYAFH